MPVDWPSDNEDGVIFKFDPSDNDPGSFYGPYVHGFEVADAIAIHLLFLPDESSGAQESHLQSIKLKSVRIDIPGQPSLTIVAATQEIAQEFRLDPVAIPVNLTRTEFTLHIEMEWRLFTPGEGRHPAVVHEVERSYDQTYVAFTQFSVNLALAYVPVSIVYCPPGQDMSNALVESTDFATGFSIGSTETLLRTERETSEVAMGVNMANSGAGIAGSASATVSRAHSRYSSNANSTGSQNNVTLWCKRSSIVIADNQRAIGRAYWGPLGDVFVLLRNLWFNIANTDDGARLAVNAIRSRKNTELLLIPVHKLLRPNGDPITSNMDISIRKELLRLDPFVRHLDDLDDPNFNLSHFVDPQADPSPGNRATRIARYSISQGVEVDLSETTEIEISDRNTGEITYEVGVSDTDSVSASLSGVLLSLGMAAQGTVSSETGESVRLSYFQSLETFQRLSKTAKCSIIRNQNATDLRDIEIWYDKHFSTFMFRVIEPDAIVISGWALTDELFPLNNVLVELVGPAVSLQTSSDRDGWFQFSNITRMGKYRIVIGSSTKEFMVNKDVLGTGNRIEMTLKGVKRKIDLRRPLLWEITSAFRVSQDKARKIQRRILASPPADEGQFARLLKKERLELKPVKRRAEFRYPKPSKKKFDLGEARKNVAVAFRKLKRR